MLGLVGGMGMRLQGLDLHQVQFTIHFVETAATVGAPYIAILPIWIINFNNEFLSAFPFEHCTPRRTRLLTARFARSSWARKRMRKTPASDVWRKASIVGYIFNRRGRQRARLTIHPQLFWYIPNLHLKPARKSITLFKKSSSTRYVMLPSVAHGF